MCELLIQGRQITDMSLSEILFGSDFSNDQMHKTSNFLPRLMEILVCALFTAVTHCCPVALFFPVSVAEVG